MRFYVSARLSESFSVQATVCGHAGLNNFFAGMYRNLEQQDDIEVRLRR